jgi:hypothetical protein
MATTSEDPPRPAGKSLDLKALAAFAILAFVIVILVLSTFADPDTMAAVWRSSQH